MLRNLNQSSGGQRVCGTPKSGVLGSLIPSTGDNGAGYTYNDLSLPADNTKEICGRITSWPSAGTLTAYEDTSFEFSGAPDGAYSFQYQLYVDGVAVGSPSTVSLAVGTASAQFSVTTDSPVFSGSASTSSSAIFNILIDDAIFAGGAVVSGAPNEASFSVTTDDAVFFGSVATAVLAAISATTADAVFSGGATVVGSPASATFAVTTDSATFFGSASTGGTFTGSLSDADITRIVQAVLLQLNNESIAAAVVATLGGSGPVSSDAPSVVEITSGLLAALQATTIPVDMKKTNGITIIGTGSRLSPWRPA